ncbi:hypothetical protein UCRPC4_g05244 [Phaeomoniella chlamydospora]|uniref:Uncharacterized protein n=1 Tax=Phaeomoniella chlamydospora TaxID=158046 RepID=A0A0G2E6R9_PHACM|nr:hypothetical protein UCRPC4_g05244 [Phaeomoniella chlamydospora]
MAGPNYGALGTTFKIARILQIISLITVIGMTANFVSEIVSDNDHPPSVLIGTLSVACVAVLYCVITSILYIDNILPFIINTALDGLILVGLVVVAVVVGKPLSYLNCQTIGKVTGDDSSALAFTSALDSSLDDENIDYEDFIGTSKATCLEMKSIWGLSIALCILFAFSAICSGCLWRQKKQGFADLEK